MPEGKEKLEQKNVSRDMAQFYHALGTFNANAVILMMQSPNRMKDVTDKIRDATCTIHDEECGPGHVYDHTAQACVRLVEPAPE